MAAPASGPNPVRQALRSVLIRVVPRTRLVASLPASAASVALTFDDGPHPELTPRLLDVLAEHNATATFFLIGEQAAKHPEIVRRIASAGHAVGHHSWTHSEPATTSARQLLEETLRTRKFLEDLIGRPAPLFRPPHGKLTIAKLAGVWRQGYAIVLWNRDPKDFQMSASADLAAWFTAGPLRAGDIVLLHDTHPHAAAALPQVLSDPRLRFEALGAP
jgi:peptidoglycan/xylan/chitin deacetylase (PgdA/CDA1 family)